MSLLMMKQEQLAKKSMHANKAQPGKEGKSSKEVDLKIHLLASNRGERR